VEFRLLGPVEAWSGDRQIDLGPRKQRLALAVLALHVNQLVPVERLVDLTWPNAPPPTARHAVHVRVSRLRAMLAQAAGPTMGIVTRGSTYTLRADPMCIDWHRFKMLVSQARTETVDKNRAVWLRRALGLWQGPALADVTTPHVEQLSRGLEEARLAASEEWLHAELRLGRHNSIIDKLIELVAQHPYRQGLVALLMLALYRGGCAPEALRTYRAARARLVDEFGLDPHAQLQELERAILRADPVLDLPGSGVPLPDLGISAPRLRLDRATVRAVVRTGRTDRKGLPGRRWRAYWIDTEGQAGGTQLQTVAEGSSSPTSPAPPPRPSPG
jgi:ABC-2 type transport system ATP-binding protein